MADNKNKNLQQLQIIKERMISAGISEEEADTLIAPLEGELMRRVCGLVWQHTASSIPDMEGKIPALIPVPDKNIVSNTEHSNNHILIEGENLLALMAMQYTHIDENGKGMIDVIYIDPPYNTGSVSFAYNDKFEKSEWLSMMDIRLKLARNLLKDDGVIFISIDDNYFAECKMLCDDIFSGQNFVANLIWKKKTAAKGVPPKNMVVTNHDYILTYQKCEIKFNGMPRDDTQFSNPDNDPRGSWKADNMKSTTSKEYFDIIMPNTGWVFRKNWAFSKESIEQMIKEDKIIWPSSPSGTPRQKRFKNEYTNPTIPITTLIGTWQSETATNKLKELIGENDFSYPKPVGLIKYLISQHSSKTSIVLDFFAGSGTTGHAVLDLNKEDGGHRQFILCTNNELGKEAKKQAKKNGYEEGTEEYESFGVCHAVTYPRMRNIFPDYPGNNLYFYRIQDTIEESSIDDVTAANMASQAVFYVAMKENVFNAEQHGNYFKLSGNGKEVVVVTDPDKDLYDVRDEISPGAFTGSDRRVYCSVSSESIKDGITYVPYPDEVMKTLKMTKKYIRREVE